MIGDRYWATGIELTYWPGRTGGPTLKPERREWSAKVAFFDVGFCNGEDSEYPPPEDWRELLHAECERIGWRCVYADKPAEVDR